MEAPEGTEARKRPERRVSCREYEKSEAHIRTLFSVEIDLDGGVSTGVEDLRVTVSGGHDEERIDSSYLAGVDL